MDDTNSNTNPSGMPDEVGINSPSTSAEVTEAKEATADKQVQEAAATLNVSQDPSKPSSSSTVKIIIALLIVVVLAVMGAIGYYLLNKMSSSSDAQTVETVTPAPTTAVVSPTPNSEDAQVDQIDTTFPESDVKSIQTDLQGL